MTSWTTVHSLSSALKQTSSKTENPLWLKITCDLEFYLLSDVLIIVSFEHVYPAHIEPYWYLIYL